MLLEMRYAKDIALAIGVIILLIIGAVVASASPENPTRQELLQTVQHIQKLAQETQAELEAEKLAHKMTSDALTFADKALRDTTNAFAVYKSVAEQEIARGNKAIIERDHLLRKLHLAKLIMSVLAVATVAFVAMRIPPPLSLYLGAGASVAAVTFIWLWL